MTSSFWDGKVVFLSGASSGIGAALARFVGERGAQIGLFARRAELLAALASDIEASGGRSLALPGDVTDRACVVNAVQQLESTLGPVDVLVANAGIGVPTPAQHFDAEAAAEIVRVNVIGASNCVAACLPSMLARRRGHLVAIASLAAFRGLPGSAAYCASKSALRTLFESLRLDVARESIRVTTILPGFVDTPMTSNRRAALPFLLPVKEGARRIARAIERGRREVAFPWQLSIPVRLLGILPTPVYDVLGGIVQGIVERRRERGN